METNTKYGRLLLPLLAFDDVFLSVGLRGPPKILAGCRGHEIGPIGGWKPSFQESKCYQYNQLAHSDQDLGQIRKRLVGEYCREERGSEKSHFRF